MNLVFNALGTLQATNTAQVGPVTDLLTIRGSVAACPVDSKSEFNINLVRNDYGSPGTCTLAHVFPSPLSA
jgi:hypothetical protein